MKEQESTPVAISHSPSKHTLELNQEVHNLANGSKDTPITTFTFLML
jgi:hypothetical protein